MASFFEKTLRFRLQDIEGVLITAGTYIEVLEPEGFDVVNFTLKRDSTSHSVMFEYSNAETPFIFDRSIKQGQTYSGYDLLKAIKDAKGVDGQCIFQIQENTGSWVEVYAGYLDFGGDNFKRYDYGISALSRRVTLGDKFRTRSGTPVDFSSANSIDGTSITGLTPSSIHLHSKTIQQVQKANSGQLEGGGDLVAASPENFFLQQDFASEVGVINPRSTLEDEYGNEVETFLYESVDNMPSNYVFFRKQGSLKISINADFRCIAEAMDGETITLIGIYAKVNDTEIEIASIGTAFNVVDILETKFFAYTATKLVNIPLGADVKIYEKWTIPNTGTDHAINIVYNSVHLTTLTFYDIEENSLANVYNLKEAINHTIESISDLTDVVVSSFFDSNAPQIYITNGYLIRGFNSQSPKFSFNDLFTNCASPLFGLGFGLLVDSGVVKCVIERYSFFYTNNEIIYIEEIFDDSFEELVDSEIVFNEVKTGYKEYPSSTDENKTNNIDEFNTLHTHLTPIQTQKKAADFISGAIGSGYKIENQRRQQFKENPDSSAKDDDKLFVITGINSNTYQIKRFATDPVNVIFDATANTISLYGTFFDIQVESITIAGTGMTQAGVYSISGVSRSGAYTVLSTSVSGDEEFSNDFTITLSTSRLRAARNDEFDTTTNVIDPNTIYNAGINPKYILFNNSQIINSGINPKAGTETIKTQEAKLNQEAQFLFGSGKGAYVLGGTATTVTMNGALQLNDINSYGRLFTGKKYLFEARLTFDEYNTIKNAFVDYNNPDLNGYIRFKEPDGNDRQGFPLEINYDMETETCKFVLREKY